MLWLQSSISTVARGDQQIFVVVGDAGFAGAPESLYRIQDCRRRVEIHRVAELVLLWRAARFDTGGQVTRVVTAGAAVPERPEQIAQRLVAQEIQRFVGDLELDPLAVLAVAGALGAALPLLLEIRRLCDVPGFLHTLDDLLNQLLELLPHLLLVAVRRIAEQLLEQIGRKDAAAEQRFENRVVQRLQGAVVVVGGIAPRVAEAA
jgi:hypothetical protein